MKFGISSRHVRLAVLTSAAAFVFSPIPAWAQKKPKTDPPATVDPGTREIAKGSGTMSAMQGYNLKLTNADKKEVFLVLQDQAGVNYTAEAEAKWLAPGLYVRFSAPFDASGKASMPLKALEVFVPSQQPRMTPDQIRDQTPGVYPEAKGPPPGAKELFNDKDKAAAGKPAAQPPAAGAQSFRVVGQLQGLRAGMMVVNAGGQPVQVELDPAVAITVTAHDLTFLQQGDEISYTGMTSSNKPDWVEVEKIDIKAPKKLTQAAPTGKSSRTRPGSKAKAGDPNDPAAADGDTKPGQRPSSRTKKPAAGDKNADKPADKTDKNAPK